MLMAMLCAAAQAQDDVHQYSRTLKFNDNGTFTIATFSDLGFNENSEDYL